MRVRVKICGIARRPDAEAAVEAGADALGFILWEKSPRRIAMSDLAELTSDLPPYIARVGVFVDAERETLLAAMRAGRLSAAQLHGSEDPDWAGALPVDWYKVHRLRGEQDVPERVREIAAYRRGTFMLDAASGPAPGGTGRTVDWRAAAKLSIRTSLAGAPRLILAGGLTPENVEEAIRMVRPHAVDVASGVESSPGIKDPARVKAFCEAVRSAG